VTLDEEWRPTPVPGYEVSNFGAVRSLSRTIIKRDGKPRRIIGRILKAGLASSGYLSVVLGRAYGTYNVHVLVATAFVGPCPDGEEVRHKDGVRTNCKAENLHYGPRISNIADAIEHGTWLSKKRAAWYGRGVS
jgi:hypothetical protein